MEAAERQKTVQKKTSDYTPLTLRLTDSSFCLVELGGSITDRRASSSHPRFASLGLGGADAGDGEAGEGRHPTSAL